MSSGAMSKGDEAPRINMVDAEAPGHDEPTEASSLLGRSSRREDTGEDDGSSGETVAERRGWESCDEFKGLPWWQTPSVYWLLGPYMLFTLAFGGIIVPRLELIVTLVCRKYFADQQILYPDMTILPVTIGQSNPQCNIASVQKNVAAFTLVLSALAGGLSAFTAPKFGSLSDRYGRTRLLAIASCGGIINEAITILAAKFPDVIDYRVLIVGSFFDGMSGSFTAVSVLGNSYVSDCTPPSKRGVALGYLQACLFIGLAFGPVLAAELIKLTGFALSAFYVSLCCHTLVIMFIWLIVPDSVSKRRRALAVEKHEAEEETIKAALPHTVSNVLGSRVPAWMISDRIRTWLPILLTANPLAPLKMFFPDGRANRRLRRNLILFGFIDTVIMSSSLGAGPILILYAKFLFNWGTMDSSRFVSIVSFFRVIALLGLFPTLNYFFRVRPLRRKRRLSGDAQMEEPHLGADELDVWVIRAALMSDVIGVLGYCFVRTEALFIASGVFGAFGGLASATIQSAITKQVPAERVGAMLGAMGLLHAISRVLAPVIFDGIYAGTIESFPQAFIVVLASLFGLSLFASVFVRPHLFLQEEGYAKVPVREEGEGNLVENLAVDEMASEAVPRI
ncbi:MFS general substrate transporter [Xylariaceae sp. FL0594]|nr:MFS general substrate transporter [Xylariaceae sp. FL0594]